MVIYSVVVDFICSKPLISPAPSRFILFLCFNCFFSLIYTLTYVRRACINTNNMKKVPLPLEQHHYMFLHGSWIYQKERICTVCTLHTLFVMYVLLRMWTSIWAVSIDGSFTLLKGSNTWSIKEIEAKMDDEKKRISLRTPKEKESSHHRYELFVFGTLKLRKKNWWFFLPELEFHL